MLSLFADQTREFKLDSLDDPLALLQACGLCCFGSRNRPLSPQPLATVYVHQGCTERGLVRAQRKGGLAALESLAEA